MVGMLSDIGNVRKINEDSVGFYQNENFDIYVIADGMGGHNAGEVASKLAVDTTIDYVKSFVSFISIESMKDTLKSGIKLANEKIFSLSKSNSELNGMGTTITACLVKENKMIVANVGDSSCFIMKYDGIIKITKDHSLVQQLVDEGSITEEEAVSHPNKNIITRALGTNIDVDIDIFEANLSDTLKIILCTDGLSNGVSLNEMYDIIMNNNNQGACKQLIELSKLKGGRDNISVIVFGGECEDDRNHAR
ncbi:protein phosphatase [Clostridium carboxidivorans P7]|uniref:Protein serine/threonine phosphatase n=1 Tax=Clostridium carboxidivorans P7 TaxID=536227 RepID=C6PUW4_9CLOT|nr:Stp1/IreP family PP2C-type Ser/Thr phosphatase [Clostridium carboxidivorans]AKN29418.1 protein phosphatase [Clostridium carboxidivorans P7]EET86941.1 protein serine/threonine phosphatase [Clostridium carboxidivorans P7]EFG89666.1 protein phosphatase 2C [Clostridium carboxidivorans P7]